MERKGDEGEGERDWRRENKVEISEGERWRMGEYWEMSTGEGEEGRRRGCRGTEGGKGGSAMFSGCHGDEGKSQERKERRNELRIEK